MECCYALKSFGIDMDPFEIKDSVRLSDSMKEQIQQYREIDKKQQEKAEARVLPRTNDVLLGRGRPFQLYSGNLALAVEIDQNRGRYTRAKKMDKKIITSEIVQGIRQRGGRFLKKVNNGVVDWEEVDFETSRLKVSHSFRTMSRWHSDNEDAYNNDENGSEATHGDSPHFLVGEEPTSPDAVNESSSLPKDIN